MLARNHDDPVALRNGRIVSATDFLAHANGLAELLPPGAPVINVCANRYEFLAGFGAAVIRGSPTLLPPNPVAGTIHAIHRQWPGSVVLADVPQPECTDHPGDSATSLSRIMRGRSSCGSPIR